MSRLAALIHADPVDLDAIASHLDGLGHPQRLAEVTGLGKKEQERLFGAAAGYRPLDLHHFVPRGREPMREVVHHGKNSLPLFTRFAKVFVRPDEAGLEELWGYNRNQALVETTVGPGYFVCYPHAREGEVLIDYLRTPPRKPEGWPEIVPNHARLSRFVYNGTQDVMRGVSTHVSVGRATRNGQEMPNFFVLCRED